MGGTKLSDFALILSAAYLSYNIYFGFLIDQQPGQTEHYTLVTLVAAAVFYMGFRWVGGYDFRRLSDLRWQTTHTLSIWGCTVALLLFFGFVGKASQGYSRGWSFLWWACTLGGLLLLRVVLHFLILRWTRLGYLVRNIVIVGAGEAGARLIADLKLSQEEGVNICGIFDDRKDRIDPSVGGFDILGTTDDLLMFVRRVPVDEIIVALPITAEQRLKSLFDKLRLLPMDLRFFAAALSGTFPVRGISYLGDVPVLDIAERPMKNWNALAKSIEDKLLGALLLLLALPIMGLIALVIKLEGQGPVFFIQERFGFNNEVIRVKKFRTMYVDKGDASGATRTIRSDSRVTRIGRVLRRLSLDELPQLLNVVRGDMSLVGPRPHAIGMRAGSQLYPEAVTEYLARHRVKPGITGWAQINGLRGEIDTLERARARVAYDLHYIEHWSLYLDLWILVMTGPSLLRDRNAY